MDCSDGDLLRANTLAKESERHRGKVRGPVSHCRPKLLSTATKVIIQHARLGAAGALVNPVQRDRVIGGQMPEETNTVWPRQSGVDAIAGRRYFTLWFCATVACRSSLSAHGRAVVELDQFHLDFFRFKFRGDVWAMQQICFATNVDLPGLEHCCAVSLSSARNPTVSAAGSRLKRFLDRWVKRAEI